MLKIISRLLMGITTLLLWVSGGATTWAENILVNPGAEVGYQHRGPGMVIGYTGSASKASFDLDAVEKKLITKVDGVVDLSLDLTQPAFDGLLEVIDYINALPNYLALTVSGTPTESIGSLRATGGQNIHLAPTPVNLEVARYGPDAIWESTTPGAGPGDSLWGPQSNRTFVFSRTGNYSFYVRDPYSDSEMKVYHTLTADEMALVAGQEVTFSVWARNGNDGTGIASINILDLGNAAGNNVPVEASVGSDWTKVSVTRVIQPSPTLIAVEMLVTSWSGQNLELGEAYFDDLSLHFSTSDWPLGMGWTLFGTEYSDPTWWGSCKVTDGTDTYLIASGESSGWIQGTIYYFDAESQRFESTPGSDEYLRWYRGYYTWANQNNLTLQIPVP